MEEPVGNAGDPEEPQREQRQAQPARQPPRRERPDAQPRQVEGDENLVLRLPFDLETRFGFQNHGVLSFAVACQAQGKTVLRIQRTTSPRLAARYNPAMAKRTPPPRSSQLELAGGELSVALLNTAGARPDNRQQGVETYADFVTWSQAVGTVSAPRAELLRRRAAERPAEAAAAFALVTETRTALAESFLAAQRREPAATRA